MRFRPSKPVIATGLLVVALVVAACGSDDSSSTTSAAPASTTGEDGSTTQAGGDGASSTTEAPPTSGPGGEDFDSCMEDEPADLQLSDAYAIEDGNFSGVSQEGLQAYMEATGECGLLTTEVDVTEDEKDCLSTAWNDTVASTEDLAAVAQAFDSGDTTSEEGNEFVERWTAEVSVACPEVTEEEVQAILYP